MAENTTTAVKPQKRSWFKGLRSEYKKIIWPNSETVAKESIAVIVISVVIGLLIALVDAVVKYGLDFIV